MEPRDIARSYDIIANRWLEARLSTTGMEQHRRALRFRDSGRLAQDVGCGGRGRFIRLLSDHDFEVGGLDNSSRMPELAQASETLCELLTEKKADQPPRPTPSLQLLRH